MNNTPNRLLKALTEGNQSLPPINCRSAGLKNKAISSTCSLPKTNSNSLPRLRNAVGVSKQALSYQGLSRDTYADDDVYGVSAF